MGDLRHERHQGVSRQDESPGAQGRRSRRKRLLRWASWLLGVVALGVVIGVAIGSSERKEFMRLVERAEPWWLAVATGLQLITYFAEGEVWLAVARTGGARVPRTVTYKLAVAKLFIDQAIPSAGISGTLVFAKALQRRGLGAEVVASAIIVGTVTYHVAYVVCLAAAVAILAFAGYASRVVLEVSAIFVGFAAAVVAGALVLSRRERPKVPARIQRIPLVGEAVRLLHSARPELVRSIPLELEVGVYQVAGFVLDAATVWSLLRSLGAEAPPLGVFASFMISNLFRTVGIVPGGLGTFEAVSIVTLKILGISVPGALSATLLFRGMSFWIPLVPGVFISRQVVEEHAETS